MAIENGDTVSIEYVGRLTDGTVFDTSRREVAEENGLLEDPHNQNRDWEPLEFELGGGQIIEGLEDGLVGMDVGDADTITIEPEKAYGESSEDLLVEHDTDEFREMLDAEPEVGMHVHAQNGAHGDVVSVDEDVVQIDFNHELADETLEFEVEVVAVN